MNSDLRHMARAGKTFFFASRWLPADVRGDVATAYTFCREVDDIADETVGGGAERLGHILAALERGDRSVPTVGRVCGLIDRFPEIAAPLLELVRACARDGAGIRIDSVEELLQYSEGVAGTVGLMMYPLLGGRESAGRRHAEALGVAMQCTNIARDVLSDLRNGRVYLPGVRLERPEVDELFEGLGGAVEQRVVAAIQGVLEVASERYSFGLEGLGYLRSDCRRAIEIAARCYAAIGGRVVCGGRLVRRRAVVPLVSKLGIALQVYLGSPSAASGSLAFPK